MLRSSVRTEVPWGVICDSWAERKEKWVRMEWGWWWCDGVGEVEGAEQGYPPMSRKLGTPSTWTNGGFGSDGSEAVAGEGGNGVRGCSGMVVRRGSVGVAEIQGGR